MCALRLTCAFRKAMCDAIDVPSAENGESEHASAV